MIFNLKPEHIKLLQAAYVDWDSCETGAPCINPKRPYGNSCVEYDVHEILYGELPENGLTNKQEDELIKIHKETKTALQIILYTGKFETGKYKTDDICSREWKKYD